MKDKMAGILLVALVLTIGAIGCGSENDTQVASADQYVAGNWETADFLIQINFDTTWFNLINRVKNIEIEMEEIDIQYPGVNYTFDLAGVNINEQGSAYVQIPNVKRCDYNLLVKAFGSNSEDNDVLLYENRHSVKLIADQGYGEVTVASAICTKFRFIHDLPQMDANAYLFMAVKNVRILETQNEMTYCSCNNPGGITGDSYGTVYWDGSGSIYEVVIYLPISTSKISYDKQLYLRSLLTRQSRNSWPAPSPLSNFNKEPLNPAVREYFRMAGIFY